MGLGNCLLTKKKKQTTKNAEHFLNSLEFGKKMTLGIPKINGQAQAPGGGANMEVAGVGRGFKSMRMTHCTPTLEVLKPELFRMLVKSRFPGADPDFLNLKFQKKGMEIYAPIQIRHPRKFYH